MVCFAGPASGNLSSCHHCRSSLLDKIIILFTLCYRMPHWVQRKENGNRQHAMCIFSKMGVICLYSCLRTAGFWLMFLKVKEKKKKKGLMYFVAGMYCSKTCDGLFWHHTSIQHSENSYLLKQEMQYQDYKSLLTYRKLEVNLANAYLSLPKVEFPASN